jgi:hypothetical protein
LAISRLAFAIIIMAMDVNCHFNTILIYILVIAMIGLPKKTIFPIIIIC